ncbi:MAG: ABC transporter ATP-binding protein [Rhodospirillaceae bacterium]|nr:ABC transporter ATP-binding protein [Rhodospirillaceae bacterium]|tara:strand:- start:39 stop:743 length:705 start_codon:yes stop_codon:yes gene_type:complete
MSYLSIQSLNAFYGKAQALSDVSLSVEKGEIIAIVGANGSGKSTLLDSIMGMVSQTGRIEFDEQDISGKATSYIVKSGIGYAPERFNLFPYMSVKDNLLVGAFTARENTSANLSQVYSLFPKLAERETQETATQSGGERQMVSLGRAIMSSPNLLLVDEPTIGLAPKVCQEIAVSLRRMRDDFGLTVVITEQNANFAMTLAERIYVLEAGKMQIEGTADELRQDNRLIEAYFGT